MTSSTTINNVTYSRPQRIGLLPWSDLRAMSTKEVVSALMTITQLQTLNDLENLANWASLNAPSMSFDFPKEDRLKALLGALRWGYITIQG